MKNILLLFLGILCFSCATKGSTDTETQLVYTTCNELKIIAFPFPEFRDAQNNVIKKLYEVKIDYQTVYGKDVLKSWKLTKEGTVEIETRKLGIAKVERHISAVDKDNNKLSQTMTFTIVSEFLIDFSQSMPLEPKGSVSGIDYPNNTIVSIAKEVLGVNKEGREQTLSPGLLVRDKVAIYPHNATEMFPDFEPAIKYYGYKEKAGDFSFRYQPLIPMLEVGDGKDTRGVGIIVINKNQLSNNTKTQYKFEGYCSIRTRSDAKETYNLGVVLGTINKQKATFKDAVVGRDYFNVGYSSSGQIYSKPFSLSKDDYLSIQIVGEVGKGRDKNRTTRFEYVKISPVL